MWDKSFPASPRGALLRIRGQNMPDAKGASRKAYCIEFARR